MYHICIYIYVCMYLRMYVVCIYMYMYVRMYIVCIYVCMYVCMYVYINVTCVCQNRGNFRICALFVAVVSQKITAVPWNSCALRLIFLISE
jgi:hypothetical protein